MRWLALRRHPGRGRRLWTVLVLLLAAAVLLPAAGVLWFMGKAVENESLAARQKLEEIHRTQLAGIRRQLANDWHQRAADLENHPPETPPATIFARVFKAGTADAAVVFDDEGRLSYPAPAVPPPRPPGHPSTAWRQAQRLEERDPEAASSAWARLAGETADRDLAARAFQARIRCLYQLDRRDEALSLLLDQLDQEGYWEARDARGRLIAPNALVLALQLIEDPASDEFRSLADRLHERLASYAEPALSAPQRRFLMGRLVRLAADPEPFPTSEAEELAARFVDRNSELSELRTDEGSGLMPSSLPGVWRLASPGGRVIGLYREETLRQELATWAGYFSVPGETSLRFLPPSADPDPEDPPFVSLPVDDPVSGWRLELRLDRDNSYRLAAERQIRAYRGTGVLVVGLILLLALVAGLTVRHQMRLTALKNDLLSTVSHELKTPLASMRLLIDTLLDGGREEPDRVKDYLEIMAAENDRLSHLVENFLTFSRLSHGRERFLREELDPEDVAEAAVTAAGKRLGEPPICPPPGDPPFVPLRGNPPFVPLRGNPGAASRWRPIPTFRSSSGTAMPWPRRF